MKIKLEIRYVGTAYHGWQIQENGATVQGVLQDAVKKRYGGEFSLTGCSRTDAGVHANSFICTIECKDDWRIPCAAIPFALNCSLPDDIAVVSAEYCGDDFHPRYSSLGKEYKYVMYDSAHKDPFYKDRGWHVVHRLDVDAMNKGGEYIVGTHDFSAFCASGSTVEDKTRTVYSCKAEREGDTVTITVSGNGFLYNMVRIIAGTLYMVGCGKLLPSDVGEIIKGLDRKKAGMTAPAGGLYLNRVLY